MALQAIVQQDLSKGTDVTAQPYLIGKQQSIVLTNLLLDEHGSLHVRDGTIIQTIGPDLRAVIKLFDFVRQDGTVYPLAIVRGTSGNNQLYNRGTTPWTSIGLLGTTEALPDILTFTNLALIINGYEVPYSWDGTTLKHLTSSSGALLAGAKHHTLHQGYYWVWNTALTSGAAVAATLTTTFAASLGTPDTDLTFTAKTPGTGGNSITIAYVNGAASVGVVGTAITITFPMPSTTAATVLSMVQASVAASALVDIALAPGSSGTGVPGPPAMGATNLTGGAGSGLSIYEGPSSLRSSDLNNPNSWPIANQLFVDKDDGDRGMGMGQFTIAESGISPSTSQILFKTFSAYQMTGVFGSTSPAFTIQKIKSDMGCVAPRTIKFAPGFGLLRLTHRGVALFDGVNDTLVSEEIRPLLFGADAYTGIDWTNAAFSYAVIVANPPLYVLFCPTQGARLTRGFAYDLIRRSWTVLAYPVAFSTVEQTHTPGVLPLTLVGGFSDGTVRTIFNVAAVASKTDDGAAIPWSAHLRPVFAPSPQQRAYYRRAILKLFHVDAAQQVFWVVLFGPLVSTTAIQKAGTLTVPAAVPPNTAVGQGYGIDPYGLFPYGGALIGSTEVDMTIDLGITATNARLLISGQGHLLIRGIEWHVSGKPLGRPSIYA